MRTIFSAPGIELIRAEESSTIVNTETNEPLSNDELITCSSHPTPPTFRRQTKRNRIASAIPLLPPVEKNHGLTSKPKHGKMGTLTTVYTNHFPVTVAPNLMLYQYDAIVERPKYQSPDKWEEATSRGHRRRFVQKLVENNAFNFIYW